MLTFLEIKKTQPKDKEYNLADGNGLYLRILPSGIKIELLIFGLTVKRLVRN